jgi:surface protein
MSVRVLNNNGSSNTDVKSKTLSNTASTPWLRNLNWPACEANPGDNRVRGLYAVWPDGGNFIAMTVSAAYTVNYGDGTTVNYTSGSTAYREYAYSAAALVGTEAPVTFTDAGDLVTRTAHGYSNGMQVRFFNITSTTGISNAQVYYVINATANTFQIAATVGSTAVTLTTDGTAQLLPYRIATVTITPQAANNLTSINLFVKHNQSGLANGYSTSWLDLAYASSTITSLTIGGNGLSSDTLHYNLERVRLNQLGSISSFSGLFRLLVKLQNVEISNTITSVTNMSFMFENCYILETVPLFNTANVTNMSSMFNNCDQLQTVPLFNTANVTNMSSMFSSCTGLETVPLFNTASVTNMGSMFNSCNKLQTVPLFNTANVTIMNNMFRHCDKLQTVPLFNTASVTNMSYMFESCNKLQTVPPFNTASVTNMSNMFRQSEILQTVPLFNTASVTNMSSMFLGCRNLQAIPALITTAVTSSANFTDMFAGCNSLARIEAKDFKFTFSVVDCKLSATALNEIYTNLPTVIGQTITVTGNYGVITDTPSIATAKGWTVTG